MFSSFIVISMIFASLASYFKSIFHVFVFHFNFYTLVMYLCFFMSITQIYFPNSKRKCVIQVGFLSYLRQKNVNKQFIRFHKYITRNFHFDISFYRHEMVSFSIQFVLPFHFDSFLLYANRLILLIYVYIFLLDLFWQ